MALAVVWAVAFGVVAAVSMLALGTWWRRRVGSEGLAQLVAGQLILAADIELVSWYDSDRGWRTTHHWVAFSLILAIVVGLACICWGGVVAHRSKPAGATG